jgi:predicted phage terminase large subunit-like protein
METSQTNKQQLIQKILELEAVKKELRGRAYFKDLFSFNKEVLKVEEGKNMVPLTEFHKELCNFIMKPEPLSKMLLIPRGHLKSTLVTVGYSLLRIVENPDVRILIANATYDMACAFLSQIKKHLQYNETLRDYYGDLSTQADKWSENMITIPKRKAFTAKKEATVTAYGMGGNLVSQHYDLIIGDDLVNRDFINTPEQIQKTVMFYKDALDLLEPTGRFIIIGTRWSDADLYGWIMDKSNPEQVYQNFDIMIKRIYTGNLETGENLQVLFPDKYNPDVIRNLKRQKGPIEFSAQYMNEPLPQESAKFKADWFKQVLEDELSIRELNYFTMVDPAIGQTKTSDKTAIVTIAVDQWNNWFVVNIIWGNFLPNEIIERVFWNWEAYHPRRIGIEMVAYQKSLQYALIDEMRRRNIFLPIVELKADKSKAERIEGLIPRYANGTLYHLTQCPFREELEEQLMRFPVGKHDDIPDALAYGLQIAHQARKKETRWHGHHGTDDWDETPKKRKYFY